MFLTILKTKEFSFQSEDLAPVGEEAATSAGKLAKANRVITTIRSSHRQSLEWSTILRRINDYS